MIYCQLMFDCMLTYIPIYPGLHKFFLGEMKTEWKSLKKPKLRNFVRQLRARERGDLL